MKNLLLLLIVLVINFSCLSQILINEASNANLTTIVRPDSTSPDWIEIYNGSNIPVNLEGYQLADGPYLSDRWSFPSVIIPANGYLIVFASATPTSNLDANFKLDPNGETISLFNPLNELIDVLQLIDINPNMSVGKKSDGVTYLFLEPTPGATNETSQGFLGFENTPTIVTKSGFYPVTIEVVIQNNSTTTGDIYYTVDGSEPTTSSTKLTTQIYLDVTLVLKARCFSTDSTLLPSFTATSTYFIGEDVSLPVVSISTDFNNLYGATGIFHNYNTDWKKPCVIEYYDKNQVCQFQKRASIKPDGGGGGSRSNSQHSVTIEPVNAMYGDGTPIYYPLIPAKSQITQYNSFYLRNGSNYWNKYMQKDASFLRMMEGTNVSYQEYTPVIVFLNGNYFGVYELREKVDEGYFETNYGNDPDMLDLLSVSYFYGPSEIRAIRGSDSSFWAMHEAIISYNPESGDFFKKCDSLLDLDNFVDYVIAENWFGNTDWLYNNMKMARLRTYDNRWRFLLQDLELGLGGWSGHEVNMFDFFRHEHKPNPYWDLYSALIKNTQFRIYFINRFADLMNTNLEYSNTKSIVDSMYLEILPELPRHFNLWTTSVDSSLTQYSNYRDSLLSILEQRSPVVQDQIVNEFNLASTFELTVSVYPPEAGTVKISTVTPTEFPWTGTYFNGNPVVIEAIPNKGWDLNDWELTSLLGKISFPDKNKLEIDSSSSLEITANFTRSIVPGENILVYPNPCQEVVTIKYRGSSSEKVEYIIANVYGTILASDTIQESDNFQTEIEVNGFTPGFYIIKIIDGDKTSDASFIKI